MAKKVFFAHFSSFYGIKFQSTLKTFLSVNKAKIGENLSYTINRTQNVEKDLFYEVIVKND